MKYILNAFYLLLIGSFWIISCGEGEQFAQGKNLYNTHCENCHMEDGTGLGANIPPLAKADYLAANQEGIACVIHKGISKSIVVNGTTYDEPMLGIDVMNEVQLTNLINYINHAWGNDYGFVTVKNIHEQLKKCN